MAIASYALTTLQAVKDELGITGTDDDAWLETSIDRASAAIEAHCGRSFGRATITAELHPAYSARRLQLDVTPIESVSEVRRLAYDGTVASTLDTTTYQIDPVAKSSLFHNLGSWQWTGLAYSGLDPAADIGTAAPLYSVDYVGGYVLPQDGPASGDQVDLPAEIEQACVLAVVDAYQSKGRDPAVKSEQLLSYSVEYDFVSMRSRGGLPNTATALLGGYRRLEELF